MRRSLDIDHFAVGSIIFLIGWYSVLPAEDPQFNLPFFMSRISVVHGLFLYEFLFIMYVMHRAVTRWSSFRADFKTPAAIRATAFLISFLAVITILSNILNIAFWYDQPLLKIGEGFRLFAIAFLVVYIYNWSMKLRGEFILQAYLLGAILAGALHLYYSTQVPFRELGGLPSLLGQNGPGPGFALGILSCALLLYFGKSRYGAFVALAGIPIFIYGVSVSYSKTSMLIGAIGAVALLASLIMAIRRGGVKATVIIFMVMPAIYVYYQQDIDFYFDGVNMYYEYKFGNGGAIENNSTRERFQYFSTTTKVLLNNPVIGAGTGGFYPAVKDADPAALPDEDGFNDGTANPHNSFLYYAASSGFIGLFLVVLLFSYCNYMLYRSTNNLMVRFLILLPISACFIVYGFTLPSLFNTPYFYLLVVCIYSILRSDKQLKRIGSF